MDGPAVCRNLRRVNGRIRRRRDKKEQLFSIRRPARQLETRRERLYLVQELTRRSAWLHLGEQGRRIRAALGGVDERDELAAFSAWERFLQGALKFPFKAAVSEPRPGGLVDYGGRVTMIGLAGVDETYRVMVQVERKRERFEFALADLTAVPKRSENYQPVDDYGRWFSNRG